MANPPDAPFERKLLRSLRLSAGHTLTRLADEVHCDSTDLDAVECGRTVPAALLRARLEEWMCAAAADRPSRSARERTAFRRCAHDVDVACALSQLRRLRESREQALDDLVHRIAAAYCRANDHWFEHARSRALGDHPAGDLARRSAARIYRVAARNAAALAEQLAATSLAADDRFTSDALDGRWTAFGLPEPLRLGPPRQTQRRRPGAHEQRSDLVVALPAGEGPPTRRQGA